MNPVTDRFECTVKLPFLFLGHGSPINAIKDIGLVAFFSLLRYCFKQSFFVSYLPQIKAIMKKQLRHLFLLLSAACVSLVLFNTCESDEDLCSYFSLCSHKACFSPPCSSSMEGDISNIKYDQYGRAISYDFEYKCHSKTYKGSFDQIYYNGIGYATSFRATVNGVSCTYP